MNRLDVRENEDAAAQLRRRMEREERRQAARRRTAATIAISLLLVVAVLAVGIAVAVRVFEPQKVAATPAPQASALAGGAAPETAVPAARQTPATSTTPKVASPKKGPAAQKATAARQVAAAKPVAARKPVATPLKPVAVASPNQSFTIKLAGSGYDPSIIKASSKSPIKLTVGKGQGCAAGFVIPSLGINKNNSKGSVTFSVGRLKQGSYTYECSMGMVSGTLVVK